MSSESQFPASPEPDGSTNAALTLGELVDEAERQLAAAGVVDSEISARRIGEAAAGVEPRDYLMARSSALTTRMVAHADDMLRRRAAGEPLQYVIGAWSFRTLDLAVDRRALIPRPETEVVAGRAIDLARERGGSPLVVDLGTGTGAIGLAVAAELPAARVVATDRSADALSLARANLAGLGRAAARVQLAHGSWFEALASEHRATIDVLVSNPPYVAVSDELPAEVRDHEPPEALFAGPRGLDDLEYLVREGRGWLAPGGWLVLECAPGQVAELEELARARGYAQVHHLDDLAGRARAIVARRPAGEPDDHLVAAARSALQLGELVVAPTDTIPGVLSLHEDEAAIRRVYAAKERPLDQPLPVLVSGVRQARDLVELGPVAAGLAEQHWPGGLTIVARRRGGPHPVHGHATLGVRAPALGWLRNLIDDVGPVTGSSANVHGFETLLDASDAASTMRDIAVVVPGRGLVGEPSTVVDATTDPPRVLRQGSVTLDLAE